MNLLTYHCPNCSHYWNLVSYNPKDLGDCPKCPEGYIEPTPYIDHEEDLTTLKRIKEMLYRPEEEILN